MSSIAVVPGSFDPITLGHLDVIRRAAQIFQRVYVVVVHNPNKTPLLDANTRKQLIVEALAQAQIPGDITVDVFSQGLLVDYCKSVGAHVLVKGLRSQVDVGYETPMALLNRSFAGVETVFLLPDPTYSVVSSSLVRQAHALGGDVSAYVPPAVANFLSQNR